MKKSLLILMAAFTAFAVDANADKGFTSLQENTLGTAMSPNGRYLTGSDPTVNVSGMMKSYVYDIATGTLQWVTGYDGNDFTKCGEFTGINDNGIICGNALDPEHMITYTDWAGTVTSPAVSAAVWKNGERTLLGYGDFDFKELKNTGDGSFATGISADGSKVAGYFSTSSSAYVKSCLWTETGGTWTMTWLPVPSDTKTSWAMAISADGNTIAGLATMEGNVFNAIVWKDGNYTLITKDMLGIDDEYGGQITFNSMSPNGRYLVITRMAKMYVYDIDNNECKAVPAIADGGKFSNAAIDDEGNLVSSLSFGSIAFGEEVYTHPFWYSFSEDRALDLNYYMNICAEGVQPDFTLSAEEKSQAVPMAISADGSVIAGNVNIYSIIGQKPQNWILVTEKDLDIDIPFAPSGLKAESESFGHVHLTWDKDTNTYKGLTLKSYNIYRDGELTAELDASAPIMEITQDNVPAGHPLYTVEAIFAKSTGTTIPSPKSAPLKVAVLDNYDMPLFEDFETSSLDDNYWTTTCEYGNKENAVWMIGGGYGYSGNGIASNTYSGEPYSTSLVSRPLDATKEDKVTVSFLAAYTFINVPDQDLSNDTISIEVSNDNGKTWTEYKSWTITELCPGTHWSIRSVDISDDAAGELFQLRIRKHGKGTSNYYVNFDNISISSTATRVAPTGLTGEMSNDKKSVTVAWQNTSQAYQLNYINEPSSYRYTIGNEGKDVIGANLFTKEELSLYDGKYLTGVSTLINYYSYVETVKGIHASVVVYENGKLIREQAIEDLPYNEDFTVILDQPVLIDADKELMIGVKVFDYDEQQIPLTYIQSPLFIAGKSDLYSEDGGTTWQRISDFYEANEERGQCCWYITGCVTDSPELTISDDEAPFSYIVFRNGVQISPEMMDKLQTRFIDNEPLQDAYYEVAAYYLNGEYSETSEQLYIGTATSVRQFVTDGVRIMMSNDNSVLSVEGEYDSASLLNINGMCVGKTDGGSIRLGNLSRGVYMLKIEKDGQTHVHKVLINR